MKNVRVVIGGNFGDEGKGLMTDYFCSQINDSPIVNIRYNGTCQAGHTVVRNGLRHVFSHIGSGTFNSNVTTFLSSDFYVNPILFNEEYNNLLSKGVKPIIQIDENAHVVLIFDILLNRLSEIHRGIEKHGSCGLGLWEAILREKAGYTFTVSEFFDRPSVLYRKIENMLNSYYIPTCMQRFNKTKEEVCNLIIENVPFLDELVISAYIKEIKKMLSVVTICNEDDIVSTFDNFVFEGAQGLLLDWGNRDYMPNLTASYTGLKNIVPILRKICKYPNSLEVCYVTRSYMTRHGAGRFNTEVENKEILGLTEKDRTNVYNNWQGSFRYGYLDLALLKESIEKDLQYLSEFCLDYLKSICITHLNETNNKLKCKNRDMDLSYLYEIFKDFHFYYSYSESTEKQNLNILKAEW